MVYNIKSLDKKIIKLWYIMNITPYFYLLIKTNVVIYNNMKIIYLI